MKYFSTVHSILNRKSRLSDIIDSVLLMWKSSFVVNRGIFPSCPFDQSERKFARKHPPTHERTYTHTLLACGLETQQTSSSRAATRLLVRMFVRQRERGRPGESGFVDRLGPQSWSCQTQHFTDRMENTIKFMCLTRVKQRSVQSKWPRPWIQIRVICTHL
jgi:hypothetical protein